MIQYSLVLRGNPADREQPEKAYATAQTRQTYDIRGLADHIVSHGCVYDRGDIEAIVDKAVACIQELLLDGYAVQLGDLGKFSVTLSSKGAARFEDFNPAVHVKKVTALWSKGPAFKNFLKNESTASKVKFELALTKRQAALAKKSAYGK